MCINMETVISFSGGRTSGYMLWRLLQEHNGKLPDDWIVIFTNTGKERNETLDFVQQCSEQWNVPVTWLEYTNDTETGNKYKVVDYTSASRNGEPYKLLISQRNYLPNPVTRFCTADLKIKPTKRFCKNVLGWNTWYNILGLRADEPRRVQRASVKTDIYQNITPLADWGITENDVLNFWIEQPFDLQLKHSEGNCDLCFLKGTTKLIGLIRRNPEAAEWWIEQEKNVCGTFLKNISYEGMKLIAESQIEIPMIFDAHDKCDVTCTD